MNESIGRRHQSLREFMRHVGVKCLDDCPVEVSPRSSNDLKPFQRDRNQYIADFVYSAAEEETSRYILT